MTCISCHSSHLTCVRPIVEETGEIDFSKPCHRCAKGGKECVVLPPKKKKRRRDAASDPKAESIEEHDHHHHHQVKPKEKTSSSAGGKKAAQPKVKLEKVESVSPPRVVPVVSAVSNRDFDEKSLLKAVLEDESSSSSESSNQWVWPSTELTWDANTLKFEDHKESSPSWERNIVTESLLGGCEQSVSGSPSISASHQDQEAPSFCGSPGLMAGAGNDDGYLSFLAMEDHVLSPQAKEPAAHELGGSLLRSSHDSEAGSAGSEAVAAVAVSVKSSEPWGSATDSATLEGGARFERLDDDDGNGNGASLHQGDLQFVSAKSARSERGSATSGWMLFPAMVGSSASGGASSPEGSVSSSGALTISNTCGGRSTSGGFSSSSSSSSSSLSSLTMMMTATTTTTTTSTSSARRLGSGSIVVSPMSMSSRFSSFKEPEIAVPLPRFDVYAAFDDLDRAFRLAQVGYPLPDDCKICSELAKEDGGLIVRPESCLMAIFVLMRASVRALATALISEAGASGEHLRRNIMTASGMQAVPSKPQEVLELWVNALAAETIMTVNEMILIMVEAARRFEELPVTGKRTISALCFAFARSRPFFAFGESGKPRAMESLARSDLITPCRFMPELKSALATCDPSINSCCNLIK